VTTKTLQVIEVSFVVILSLASVAAGIPVETTTRDGAPVPIAPTHSVRDPGERVRTASVVLAGLIQIATERSTTFRRLVGIVNASDGIVYVDAGTCGHGVRACLVSVVQAGPSRLVYIRVDMRVQQRALAAAIGHELQHAVEVLSEAGVTSNAEMYFFYRRTGRRSIGDTFETLAALDAGYAVLSELDGAFPTQ
jgi:hypothetical protein